ncbi:hypothetical protein [Microbacterium paulum]
MPEGAAHPAGQRESGEQPEQSAEHDADERGDDGRRHGAEEGDGELGEVLFELRLRVGAERVGADRPAVGRGEECRQGHGGGERHREHG